MPTGGAVRLPWRRWVDGGGIGQLWRGYGGSGWLKKWRHRAEELLSLSRTRRRDRGRCVHGRGEMSEQMLLFFFFTILIEQYRWVFY